MKERLLHLLRLKINGTSRVAFTRNGISISISNYLKAEAKETQIQAFIEWARKKVLKHPELIDQYLFQRVYKNGDILELYEEKFLIKWITSANKEATIKIRQGELILSFPENAKEDRKQTCQQVNGARIMAIYFKDKLTKRVHELNQLYFKQVVKNVVLKKNSTNWGSCSIRDNINLSVSLLFAPVYVIDYVIIHELTHLIHMNHSDAYWAHVGSVMPEYMVAEKWLKKHGNKCVF